MSASIAGGSGANRDLRTTYRQLYAIEAFALGDVGALNLGTQSGSDGIGFEVKEALQSEAEGRVPVCVAAEAVAADARGKFIIGGYAGTIICASSVVAGDTLICGTTAGIAIEASTVDTTSGSNQMSYVAFGQALTDYVAASTSCTGFVFDRGIWG